MKDVDKRTIIKHLKKLDLYIDNLEVLEVFPESQINMYKIFYWLIHEIYYSPYRIFLNKLTREQFLFRYYKAKKYMSNENGLDEFIRYFMRCIQEEMERGNKINDRKSAKEKNL